MEITSRTAALLMIALLSITLCVVSLPIFTERTGNNMEAATAYYDDPNHDINDVVRGKAFPVITAENQRIRLNQNFDPKAWVKVNDPQDGNITSRVQVFGSIDNTKKGDYEIRYSVRNSYGLKTVKKIRVIVD